MNLFDPESESAAGGDQKVAGWSLLAATAATLVVLAVSTAKEVANGWPVSDWPLSLLVLAGSPWLLRTGWRLARGQMGAGPLMPAWALLMTGIGMEVLAELFRRSGVLDAGEERQIIGFLVLPGIGAIVLGATRWWRRHGEHSQGS